MQSYYYYRIRIEDLLQELLLILTNKREGINSFLLMLLLV
jgi:hypothetical protein